MFCSHGIHTILLSCILLLIFTEQFRINTNNQNCKPKYDKEFRCRVINYKFNTEPITLDGHYDDDARKWSKILPGEILLGDLGCDIDGNFFVKMHIAGHSIKVAIPAHTNSKEFSEYDPLQNLPCANSIDDNARDEDEVSLCLDRSKDPDQITKSILLSCKNMVLRKPETKMSYEKFDWEGITFNPPRSPHYIHPKKLQNKQIEVLITDTNPENDIIRGELFTHDTVEQKRREYLTVYHMLHTLSATKQHYHLNCIVESVVGNVIKLNVLNGLCGYALKIGMLKNVQPGQALDLVAVGCDPLLERIFLTADDGEVSFNYEPLAKDIENEVVEQLLCMNQWFRAEIMKFSENGLVVRICGISNPVLAFVPTNHLPYCGSSGVIDNMYMRNFCQDPRFASRYIASKLGKLCHISHYDNTLYVRFHKLKFPMDECSTNKLEIKNFDIGKLHLTTRPKVKWSTKMLKIAQKISTQSLEDLKSIDIDHFYPAKILFQANGHVYIAVNVNMRKNFDFENDGIIGIVPIDEYFAIAKPGALIHARVNRVETVQRKDQVLKHAKFVDKEISFTAAEKVGPLGEYDKVHILWMSFQTPEYFNSLYTHEEEPGNFTYLPYYSDSHPEVYTESMDKGRVSNLVKEEYEDELFWVNRDEAIRKAFTKHWFKMYEREVELVNTDPVAKIFEALKNKSGSLAQVIDSMSDFHKFRQLPLKQLLRHFEQLLVILNTFKQLPLEKIFYHAVDTDSFYKIMSATIVPRNPSGNDFLSVSEVEAVLSKFLPEDSQSQHNFITTAIRESVNAINISRSDGYTILTDELVTPANIAISILVTLLNPKYGLMALVRHRHRTMPNEVFSTSRQKIHYNSSTTFDHLHDRLSRAVKVLGENKLLNIKSMPPWPYLVKSTQRFYAHLTDMGFFELARSYNKLLSMLRSDQDLENIPDDLPEDYENLSYKKPSYDLKHMDQFISSDHSNMGKKGSAKRKENSMIMSGGDKLGKDFKKIHSKEEIDRFFEQIDEMNLVYGLRIPLF